MWLKEIKNQEKDLVLSVKQKCSTYCMKNGKVQITSILLMDLSKQYLETQEWYYQ